MREDDDNVGTDATRVHGLSPGTQVRIRVADNGPAIPQELRSHIFEPLFTTKGAGDGKGLGLAIAYSLVRGWNGNLSVRSDAGDGAIFEMLVPIADGG